MSGSAPYQPLWLRILHSMSGVLAIAAIITGFLVYNRFDGRFGDVPIANVDNIIDIHGTIAVSFLCFFPIFALYSLHAGKRKLLQSDSVKRIISPNQLGSRIWWVSGQRIANTLMLIASVLALISGRMMEEEWLPSGELDNTWYYLHLTAWAIMVCSLAIHILMSAKVGGIQLLTSIFSLNIHPQDSPRDWLNRASTWWGNLSRSFGGALTDWQQNQLPLKILEVLVILGIIIAVISPVLS